jgi:uncharacterized protein (DUF488 family)
MTKLFTIGFTQKSAEQFFSLLQRAGVRRLIDTRLNNRSQLAGFSKADDLRYFLKAIGSIDYRHATEMAPTQDMLDRYKKLKGSWPEYEREFNSLIEGRNLAAHVRDEDLDHACLLCSEHEPDHCHRRLVAEYLRRHDPEIEIHHLL